MPAGNSTVLFRCQHVGVSRFYGRFNSFSDEVVHDGAAAAQSSIAIEIQADSGDTNNEGRDMHLRSNDFFSAKEFPSSPSAAPRSPLWAVVSSSRASSP